MGRVWVILVASAVVVVACERQPEKAEVVTPGPQVTRPPAGTAPAAAAVPPLRQGFTSDRITRGAALYRQHCLQCHGPEAQGHPDWQTPSSGTFTAAPPLDGTGNAWKRKKRDMVAVIRLGASRKGIPAMPAFKDRLSDEAIEDVITWFQVLWPPEIYELWLNANMESATPKG
ncbi:MAG: cytochrome c [Acidiferrobacterales bacterium]|jgi:mono/diheme cytochrome c family protein